MSQLQELEQDLQELQFLFTQVHRKGNLDYFLARIQSLEKEIVSLAPKKNLQVEQKLPENEIEQIGTYLGITKYAWEQEGKKVKIRIQLDEIGQLPKEQITCDFQGNSMQLKIKQYKGGNHAFGIQKTFDKINPKESTFKTTNNSIIITLQKVDDKQWDQLYYKDKPFNADKMEKDQDPQASLMNMMKEMYQNGDSDMKRTIAQAWTKSQEEKAQK